MKLFIDLGNTRLKWATGQQGDTLSLGQSMLNTDLSHQALIELWQGLKPPERILISQVGVLGYLESIKLAANQLWPDIDIQLAKPQARAFGVINAYEQPEKLGVDRWLGMISAYHKHRQALCLVGCGTALTVDIMDNDGKHHGGLISSGLRLMRESLAAKTANLPLNYTAYPFALAKHTDAAIYNGTLAAAYGFIEICLKNQSHPMLLILTGGDAKIISQVIDRPAIIEPDLVLKGLALIA